MSARPQADLATLLETAGQLLAGGASQREVQRSTGLARETIRKNFPGQFWTYRQGGDFRGETRQPNNKVKIRIGTQ